MARGLAIKKNNHWTVKLRNTRTLCVWIFISDVKEYGPCIQDMRFMCVK